MGTRIYMSDDEKDILSCFDYLPKPFIVHNREYFPKKFISSAGKKSVVWKGVDDIGNHIAIKLATYRDYMDKSYLQELKRAAILKDFPEYFAQYYDADIIELNIPDKKIKCVCFIEEWIDGQTLDKYIENNPITPSFILRYVKELCQVLEILGRKKIRHDDLHWGNVMVAKARPELFDKDDSIKIIDMGSLKPIDAPLKDDRYDDFEFFCDHLIKLLNAMQCIQYRYKKPLSEFERKFRKNVIQLIYNMVDESKELTEPSKIIDRFDNAYGRAQISMEIKKEDISDPFDYISAEHITDDSLLIDLFAESCPWMDDVSNDVPILLTGPRGCGKSTLFRRLALKAILNKNQEEIINTRQIGFYISCSKDLRNRFGWIVHENTAEKSKKEITHYFNLLLTREVAVTLSKIAARTDREQIFGFGLSHEKEFYNFINHEIKINEEKRLKLQGIPPMERLVEILDFELNSCYEKILRGNNVENPTTIAYLPSLTNYLKIKIPFFEKRTITFFLDDYSIHRIPKPVQIILNPIIWDRQNHLFKLSSEKYGAEQIYDFPSDSESSPTADLSREFREVDCGRHYLQMSDKGQIKELTNFARDLLDHRLRTAKYKGTTEKLIGHSYYEEGSLAKALKRGYPSKRDQYHGLETISEICSGDISALIEIYRRIFKEGKVTSQSVDLIPKNTQHAAIISTSRNFFELIRTFNPHGERMYKISLNFGTLCRRLLLEGNELPEDSGKVPYETTRIEVDSIPTGNEDWTDDQDWLMKELVRRSIFIELEPSRGRRTLGPTWRWQLRRIYCPHFGNGLHKHTAIKWNTSQLKYFLTNPTECCKAELEIRSKTSSDDKKGRQSHEGPDLFFYSTPDKEDSR